MEKVILDMDPGIDDAMALILAMNSVELDILGITTVAGNVTVEKTTKNVLRILNYIDKLYVDVYMGAYKPLINELYTLEDIHGYDGLGDINLPTPKYKVKRPAVNFLIKCARKFRGDLTIIATGPLTNIALAILIDKDFPSNIKRLIHMGGAFGITEYGYGNDTPTAEFNIYTDPEAAKIVYNNIPDLHLIGLDITNSPKIRIDTEGIERIKREGGRYGALLYEMTRKLYRIRDSISLHDTIPVAYMIDNSILKMKKYWVDVELEGIYTRGQTIVDRRKNIPSFLKKKRNAYIAIDIDHKKYFDLLWNRIFSPKLV
jgi:inosine-uridine nucleoside N-ribohydrolase